MDKNEDFTCPHNEGVECSRYNRSCSCCGWNPEVAKARLAQYYRENNIMPIYNSEGNK